MSVVTNILRLKENNELSKHEQLVHGVIEAIDSGKISIGDQLPSINNMVEEVGFARKTIFKAYEELKDRGLIESRKLRGYFVISQETNVTLRMALLLYAFQSFQEEFYNTFRKEVGDRFQIDVYFHHNNISIFETLMANITGKYGMYVIAPVQNKKAIPLLQRIAPEKLLIVDRYIFLGPEYSYISQEFENAMYSNLAKLLPEMISYKKITLFFNEKIEYPPIGIRKGFERLVAEKGINSVIEKEYIPGSVKKGHLYFILNDTMLWHILRDCVQKGYVIGEDVGILSHDDNVAKEIAFGGITTISTDFREMAKMAARHLKRSEKTQIIVPSNLIKRQSL